MIDHGDGTVTDERTGLMWEQHPNEALYSWEDATQIRINDLNAARLGGHDDWRLPTVQELVTLVDYSRHHPAIHPIFATAADGYWSSTTVATFPSYAWLVYFGGGDVGSLNVKSGSGYVRAVRGGSLDPSTLRSENAQLRAQLKRIAADFGIEPDVDAYETTARTSAFAVRMRDENAQLRAQLAQRTAALQKLIKAVEAMPSDHAIPPAWLLLGLTFVARDAD